MCAQRVHAVHNCARLAVAIVAIVVDKTEVEDIIDVGQEDTLVNFGVYRFTFITVFNLIFITKKKYILLINIWKCFPGAGELNF